MSPSFGQMFLQSLGEAFLTSHPTVSVDPMFRADPIVLWGGKM